MFDKDFVRYTLTPLIAVAGLLLGIYNLWLNKKPHRVRLRTKFSIRKSQYVNAGLGDKTIPFEIGFRIECLNDSYFEVSISDVGLVFRERWRKEFVAFPLTLTENRIPSRSSKKFNIMARCDQAGNESMLFALANDKDEPLKHAVGVYFRVTTGDVAWSGGDQFREIIGEIDSWLPEALEYFSNNARRQRRR